MWGGENASTDDDDDTDDNDDNDGPMEAATTAAKASGKNFILHDGFYCHISFRVS